MITTRKAIRDGLKGKGKWTPRDMAFGDRTQANWKRQEKGQNVADPLEITIGLMDMSDNNIILDFICESQGGVFIKNEEPGESTGNLHQDAAGMLSELTDVYVVMTKSMKDGKIDMQEAAEIRKEVKEAMQQIEAMLDNVQSGKYQ